MLEIVTIYASKWSGELFNINVFFNVENSTGATWNMRKNCCSKKKKFTQFVFLMLEIALKREENMKFEKKNLINYYIFQY